MTNLKHIGVRGMRWGHRKALSKAAINKLRSDLTVQGKDSRWKRNVTGIRSLAPKIKAYTKASSRMNGEVTRINNKPEYKGLNLNSRKNRKTAEAYYKEYADTFQKILNEESRAAFGKNPSGTKEVTVSYDLTGKIKFNVTSLSHDSDGMNFFGILDEMGYIKEFVMEQENAMVQSDIDRTKAFLAHVGVKGMKWGVRKAQAKAWGREALKTMKHGITDAGASDKAEVESYREMNKTLGSRIRRGTFYSKTAELKDLNQRTQRIGDEIRANRASKIQKVKEFLKGIGPKLGQAFNKAQVKSINKDIKLFKDINAELSKQSDPISKKLVEDYNKAIKDLEDDLNTTFTPAELERYRSEG